MLLNIKHLFFPPGLFATLNSLIIFIMIFSISSFAQSDTMNVPSDIPPGEGNLNIAVQTAIDQGTLSTTVFRLESNGYYILTKTITISAGEHLTIIAPEPGITQETAPPQIVWSSKDSINTDFNFDCYGDITLKNVWLLYANTEGKQIGTSLQMNHDSLTYINGKGEIGIFDGVIFDYSSMPQNYSGTVGVTAKHFKGTFRNCYFRNCTDPHYRYWGRAVSFPYNSKAWHNDSLIFTNCTFANIGCVYSQEWDNYVDNIYLNHCTFFDIVSDNLESGRWHKMSDTNSIFMNTYMFGDIPEDNRYWGECCGGTIRIDSISNLGFDVLSTEQERRILFTNSSHYIEDWLSDWMHDNPYSVWVRDSTRCGEECVPRPQPMLSPGTLVFFDSVDLNGQKVFPYMNRANLYDSTDPGFILAPANTEDIKIFLLNSWDERISANHTWAYLPDSSIQHAWPLPENLAYINQTLLTAGMDGFPLGDLYHWFPDRYIQWKAQESQENERIYQWLETGIDPLASGSRKWPDSRIPQDFSLSQNYPIPFNPVTHINYSIPISCKVSLKVFNLLGEEVATLFKGYRQAGNYEVVFDGSKLASGVYFYNLKTNSFTQTKRLILIR